MAVICCCCSRSGILEMKICWSLNGITSSVLLCFFRLSSRRCDFFSFHCLLSRSSLWKCVRAFVWQDTSRSTLLLSLVLLLFLFIVESHLFFIFTTAYLLCWWRGSFLWVGSGQIEKLEFVSRSGDSSWITTTVRHNGTLKEHCFCESVHLLLSAQHLCGASESARESRDIEGTHENNNSNNSNKLLLLSVNRSVVYKIVREYNPVTYSSFVAAGVLVEWPVPSTPRRGRH